MRNFIPIIVLLAVNCTVQVDEGSETNSDVVQSEELNDCNPVGTWTYLLVTREGDCFPEDFALPEQTAELSEQDFNDESFNRESCKGKAVMPFATPETDELYAIDGTVTQEVEFSGDGFTGTASLVGNIVESGETIGECSQQLEIVGSR